MKSTKDRRGAPAHPRRTARHWLRFGAFCGVLVLAGGAGVAVAAQDESAGATARQLQTLGWLESVRLQPWNVRVPAKLDTGAKTSAIHATDVELFERDGERMVRFKLAVNHDAARSKMISVERPLVREVNIKLRGTDDNDERPAVRLTFCLAGRRHSAVFTLTDRDRFNYPVLLGRRFLSGKIAVNPAETFTIRPDCPAQDDD